MEINGNQYFLIGVIFLLLGLQIRMVETFVLNEKVSRFVAEKFTAGTSEGDGNFLMPSVGAAPRRSLHPPIWAGYALMSVGAVLILHSLAMKRPGG